jgi:predicted hydrocarbon binding protein
VSNAQIATLYYPNRFARDLFTAMEEVMGKHGLDATLSMAGLQAYVDQPPPDDLAREFEFTSVGRINRALDDMYGLRGGRGMALRAGRAWFAQGMKSFGALRGVADPAFRRLPLEDRCRLALNALAGIFTRFSDQQSQVEELDGTFRFVVAASPFAWDFESERPVCHPLVGLLQENLRWASNGREYIVRETHCRATGDDSCTFVVNKHAAS